MSAVFLYAIRFNTQPPEGGWDKATQIGAHFEVSTHSRLKAAGYAVADFQTIFAVSTHSRLKAAGLKPRRR